MRNEIEVAWEDVNWPLSIAVYWIATGGDASKLDDLAAERQQYLEKLFRWEDAYSIWKAEESKINDEKTLSVGEREKRLAALGPGPEKPAEPSATSLENAAIALFEALQGGKPVAHGVKRVGGDGSPEVISKSIFTKASPFVGITPLNIIFNEAGNTFLIWGGLVGTPSNRGKGDHIIGRIHGEKAIGAPTVNWRNITVERAEIQQIWPQRKSDPTAVSEEEVLALLRDAIQNNGGFLGQNEGAKIVRERFPHFDRDQARELTKRLTGNTKQGPRGPRKNRAV